MSKKVNELMKHVTNKNIVIEEHVLNEKLLDSQNVRHNVTKILDEHEKINMLFMYAMSKKNLSFDERERIKTALKNMEYTLQELWGFPRDENRHTHRLRLPGCTCPKDDNREMIGKIGWWVNEHCPWHSISRKTIKYKGIEYVRENDQNSINKEN